jgi:hypothetical protein
MAVPIPRESQLSNFRFKFGTQYIGIKICMQTFFKLKLTVHAPPFFGHRTRGFLKARGSREPGNRLTTGCLSSFHLLLKVSCAKVHSAIAYHTFLFLSTHKPQAFTFSLDISLGNFHAVQLGQGISKGLLKL